MWLKVVTVGPDDPLNRPPEADAQPRILVTTIGTSRCRAELQVEMSPLIQRVPAP
jgi:hypothetical protein